MENFSSRLSEILEQKKISGYQLAKDIHISRATVSNYINGKTAPNKLIATEMSKYFNVSRKWLMTGEGDRRVCDDKYKELAQFSKHEIAKYLIDRADVFRKYPLFKSYIESLVSKRTSEIANQEFLSRREEEENPRSDWGDD